MSSAAMQRAVDEAVRRKGSRTAVAAALGITRQAMDDWDQVPVKRAAALEHLSGVSRCEMRPDIWRPETTKATDGRRVYASSDASPQRGRAPR